MKKFFILIAFAFLSSTFMSNNLEKSKIDSEPIVTSSYCDGWKEGYVSGYCYGSTYGCLKPLAPLCPLPRIGESSYKDGYNRGFIAGRAAKEDE